MRQPLGPPGAKRCPTRWLPRCARGDFFQLCLPCAHLNILPLLAGGGGETGGGGWRGSRFLTTKRRNANGAGATSSRRY